MKARSNVLTAMPPHLGLFWVAPDPAGAWDILAVSRPASDVAEHGGFRTLDLGHAEAWPRLRGSLARDYGDYPRGRVNWRAEDDRFLLLLDAVLLSLGWRDGIARRFALPAEATLTLTDPHYRSRHRPPVAG